MSSQLLDLLKAQREQLASLKNSPPWGVEYEVWKSSTSEILEKLLGHNYIKLLHGQETVVVTLDDINRRKLYFEELERMGRFLDSSLSEYEKVQKIRSAQSSPSAHPAPSSSKSDIPLLSPQQPGFVGRLVWLLQFPKRLDRHLTKYKYLRRPILRWCLIGILFILVILVTRGILITSTHVGDHFEYQPLGVSYSSKSASEPTIIEVWFQANVTNYSTSPRYLANLIDVLWRNELLDRTWDEGFSDAMGTVYVVQGQNRIPQTLPILFQPNESRNLAWRFEFTVSDPATMQWLSERTGQGVFTWSKNEIDFLMQDSRGNIYNRYGELQSQPVMDAWWVFPNNRSIDDKITASFDLVYKILIWKIEEVVPLSS